MQRSPQEHFHAWLRTLDPETEGLPPPRHRRARARAGPLRDRRSFARTPALEDAAYRLFVAEQRSAAARAVALAILDRCLDGGRADPPPGMRETLERVAHVAERRDPVVSDVARECRWRLFDGPVVAAVREAAYADAEAASGPARRRRGRAGARRGPAGAGRLPATRSSPSSPSACSATARDGASCWSS